MLKSWLEEGNVEIFLFRNINKFVLLDQVKFKAVHELFMSCSKNSIDSQEV